MGERAKATEPTVSVVIASKVGAPFIDACLRSIEEEAQALDAEVIVVAAGEQDYAARIASDYPWVKVVHAPDLKKVPALRCRGVEKASGELLCIIEEHCSAAPGWLRLAVKGHGRGEYAAVGGPVVDDNYDRLRDWVTYFCEYNSAMPPVPAGDTDSLNDANIAYRRQVLLNHIELLPDGYWPMTLHPTLLAEGVKLLSVPDMVVHHLGPWNFGYYLHQRFLFSRAFGGVRAQSETAGRRLAYLIGAPLIPVMLLARMTRSVWDKRCRVKQFVLTLPLIVVALIVLVAGEWVGYLLGPGDALSKVE